MMAPVVGVISGAEKTPSAATLARVALLGRTVAEHGYTLMVSQAKLAHAAKEGARSVGGQVLSLPLASQAMGDEEEIIRRSDIVVIVGSRDGPPGELATAYTQRRPIGVLTQSSGVADAVEALVRACAKPNAGVVVCDDQPERLVDRLIACRQTA